MHSYGYQVTSPLPDLPKATAAGGMILEFGLASGGPANNKARRLWGLLAASTDSARRFYRMACAALAAYNSPGNQSLGLEISDYLEASFMFTRRALGALDILRSQRDGVPIRRDIRKRIEALDSGSIDLRDAIIHMHEDIRDGHSPDGTPLIAMPTTDASNIAAGSTTISCSEYVALLCSLTEPCHAILEDYQAQHRSKTKE